VHTEGTTVRIDIDSILYEILDSDRDNCEKGVRELYRNLLNNFSEPAAASIFRLG
jgi:hypothetical protein